MFSLSMDEAHVIAHGQACKCDRDSRTDSEEDGMRCEADHRDGGVCLARLVNGECVSTDGHAE